MGRRREIARLDVMLTPEGPIEISRKGGRRSSDKYYVSELFDDVRRPRYSDSVPHMPISGDRIVYNDFNRKYIYHRPPFDWYNTSDAEFVLDDYEEIVAKPGTRGQPHVMSLNDPRSYLDTKVCKHMKEDDDEMSIIYRKHFPTRCMPSSHQRRERKEEIYHKHHDDKIYTTNYVTNPNIYKETLENSTKQILLDMKNLANEKSINATNTTTTFSNGKVISAANNPNYSIEKLYAHPTMKLSDYKPLTQTNTTFKLNDPKTQTQVYQKKPCEKY